MKVNFFTFETMEKSSAFTIEFRLTLRRISAIKHFINGRDNIIRDRVLR